MYRLSLFKDGIEEGIEVELEDDCLTAENLFIGIDRICDAIDLDLETYIRETTSKNLMQ